MSTTNQNGNNTRTFETLLNDLRDTYFAELTYRLKIQQKVMEMIEQLNEDEQVFIGCKQDFVHVWVQSITSFQNKIERIQETRAAEMKAKDDELETCRDELHDVRTERDTLAGKLAQYDEEFQALYTDAIAELVRYRDQSNTVVDRFMALRLRLRGDSMIHTEHEDTEP